jgi:hypothetical protein
MKLELVGQKFGRLTVVRRALPEDKRYKSWSTYYWLCQCDCDGKEYFVTGSDLVSGHTQSCGCFRRDLNTKHRGAIHGKRHPLYGTWLSMRDRCNRSKNTHYLDYGGRGIYVCPQWQVSFINFLRDMEPTWKEGLQLDRIENDGPYYPWNCEWKTSRENSQNTRLVEEVVEKKLQQVLQNLKRNLSQYSEEELIYAMTT